ncbi:aminoglycoside N-acetyltransferase AAC(3)-VIa [Escherichia coli]|nr:aminoglycoside N-acetyltransferase AAC(3)-VIa [Escherichia coli]
MTDPRKNGDLHEPATAPATPWSKSELVRQLRDLGVRSGDMVMPHVSLRAVGPLADGPQTPVDALIEAVGPTGNILAFVSWRDSPYEQTLGHDAPPAAIAQSWPAFDPDHAPAYPGFGAINEFIRTYPGCRRSAHPDASMAAIGPDAAWLVAPHEMGAAYGPRSPIARFLAHAGKILSIGAGPDAVTALHYAEAVARIEGKRRVTYSMPLLREGKRVWVTTSDWDSNGILDEYAAPDGPDAVERIARDYLARTRVAQGPVGGAQSRLIDAADIVSFGIEWLEARHAAPAAAALKPKQRRD